MVFGKKKKETMAEKKARLEKELAATVQEAEKELTPPEPPTMVQEVTGENNSGVSVQSLIEELETKYGQVFPELGPSGHAAVERLLLLALVVEIRELRKKLKQ